MPDPIGRPNDDSSRTDPPEAASPGLAHFVGELTRSQTGLRAYIFAAVGNHNDASDILQRTNLVLWKNAASFRSDADFMPWAVTLARYEILSHYRDQSRDRLVFAEDVATMLIDSAQEEVGDPTERQAALRRCVAELPPTSRDMVRLRYDAENSLAQIAETLNRSENAIKCAFVRVRKTLEACVERQLRAQT